MHLNIELKHHTSKEVINALQFMLGESKDPPNIKHALFETARWEQMLLSGSYYFNADACSTLRFDDISNSYFLCIRCNLKNYCSEIEGFLSWVKPYLNAAPGDFLGFMRCKETEIPTLLYFNTSPKHTPHYPELFKCV